MAAFLTHFAPPMILPYTSPPPTQPHSVSLISLCVPYLTLCPLSHSVSLISLCVPYLTMCPLSPSVSIISLCVPYLPLCPLSPSVSLISLCVPYLTLCPLSHSVSLISLCVPYLSWSQMFMFNISPSILISPHFYSTKIDIHIHIPWIMFISSDPSILGARTSLENDAESRLILVFSKLIR